MATFGYLPYGPDVTRGAVRALGLTVVICWDAAALVFVAVLDLPMTGGVLTVLGVVIVTLLLSVPATVSVILFNVPKFVVPPHMRADPGVFGAWRARRAARRR
ncbi:hypothetical protein [Streptomyces sp. NPDC058964]|uniref:hypothetical protein n=1 Tax=Streptomyces sp. NPDC058964 TaxID=3346681 RepID=UPI0036B9F621